MSIIVFDSRTTFISPFASIVFALCILHIYLYCRSFASSSIVQLCRRRVERPVNREKSLTHFLSTSSSSLITACNPLYRHLQNTHVYSLQSKNIFSCRMHMVQRPDMYAHNIRPVDPAHIQKFKYVICSFVHRLSSKASSDAK
jgi:hypothetical protein